MSFNSNKAENFHKLENIAIIGNGGRENALAWAIQKNNQVKQIFIVPGNGGSHKINKCQKIDIDINNHYHLLEKLQVLDIDLIVIGPETPLADGLGDFLRSKDFFVFGPGKDGAKLESSKYWAKNFMKNANIPTANFWKVSNMDEAKNVILNSSLQFVVKADGLASGKGVFIPQNKEDTLLITKEILEGKFGSAGDIVLLEEKIQGPEISVFALCDGKNYVLLPTAQDHKRLEEKDKGLNTGGMGAYSPAPIITDSELIEICHQIIEPTINELVKINIDYRGVIYFGLMITEFGPKVIEYNCRFGDPECQTIMPLMDNNFAKLLQNCATGNLIGNEKIPPPNKVSACVIAASKGYPLEYKVGLPINFNCIENENFQIFHSGTSTDYVGNTITDGGRVLSIVCQSYDFDNAFKSIYANLEKISFDGMYYRKDIGHQVRHFQYKDDN